MDFVYGEPHSKKKVHILKLSQAMFSAGLVVTAQILLNKNDKNMLQSQF